MQPELAQIQEEIIKKTEDVADVVTTRQVNFSELVAKRNAAQEQLDIFDESQIRYRQPLAQALDNATAEIAKYKAVGFTEKVIDSEIKEK